MSSKPHADSRVFDGLNPRQSQFIIGVFAGRPAVQAYATAYDRDLGAVNSKPYEVAAVNASRLLRKAKVRRSLEGLRSEGVTETTLTFQRKREILCDIVEGRVPGATTRDALRAIQLDNAMTGDGPTKHQGEVTTGSRGLDPRHGRGSTAQASDLLNWMTVAPGSFTLADTLACFLADGMQ